MARSDFAKMPVSVSAKWRWALRFDCFAMKIPAFDGFFQGLRCARPSR
jgi:hypothetical protein